MNGSMEGLERSSVLVVGAGHVGLVTAAGLARLNHKVVGLDTNSNLIESLRNGQVHFMEPGLPELLEEALASGNLSFTSSYSDCLKDVDFVFFCVNTPSTVTGAADLRYVRDAAACIGVEMVRTGQKPILINKSTSPIGTGETIDAILRSHLADEAGPPTIVSNPEFLREGSAVKDFFHPERIVIGCDSRVEADRVATLYAGLGAPKVITDLRSAEMIKYVSNAFLATRVSFINEIARLCDRLGVDVDMVAEGAGMDARIGRHFFRPGIGYGGSCLPKDVAALCYTGDLVGSSMRLLSAVQEVNVGQRRFVVQRLRSNLGSLEGKTVGVWGLTFKGGSEDLRESPALDVVRLLRNDGATIRAYDPCLGMNLELEDIDVICADALEAAAGVDALVILTDWQDFAKVDLDQVQQVMAGDLVYDGRNVLERRVVEQRGLRYEGVGRPIDNRLPPRGERELREVPA